MLAVALALLACGAPAEPATERATPTQAAVSSSAVTEAPASAGNSPTAPPAMLAPNFDLPSVGGETISLGSYAGDQNVVLVFYRGFW